MRIGSVFPLCGFLILGLLLLFGGCATATKNIGRLDETSLREGISEKVAVTEFILGPGDEVEITVWREPSLSQKVKIDPAGKIFYPLVGEIQVSGLSIVALREEVRKGLLKYYVNPQVGVSVVSLRSQKVFVLGEVKKPGVFQMEPSMRVLEALSLAGGFSPDAHRENVLLIRGDLKKPYLKTLDLRSLLEKGDLSQNLVLERGDIIFVPSTRIADVSRFFQRLSKIISPIVDLERGIILAPTVGDVLRGKKKGKTIVVTP